MAYYVALFMVPLAGVGPRSDSGNRSGLSYIRRNALFIEIGLDIVYECRHNVNMVDIEVIREGDLESLQIHKARSKYRSALQSGKLVRGASCAECGSTEKIEGHHENIIEKPLEVIWLCRECHKKRKRELGQIGKLVLAIRIESDWYMALKKLSDSENSISDLGRDAIKRFLKAQGCDVS